MVAVGASLLVAAGFAGSAASGTARATSHGAKKGGTLNVDLTTDIDYADPSLSYYVPSWEIEYATALKLLNYPDAEAPRGSQIVPEAAVAMPRVSNGGKTYVFKIRPGFRLSNGAKVTAANFAYAINRAAKHEMQSQAQPFMSDIAGAQAAFDGKASTVSGVKAHGMTLSITLTHAAPDFLVRLATPFFQAIPLNLPIDPNGVHHVDSGGPYYIDSYTPNKQIVIKRNKYYGGKRPHNVNTIVYSVGKSLEAIQLEVERGSSDYAADGVPPSAYADLAKKYGVTKKPGKSGQLQLRTTLSVFYLAMNTSYGSNKSNPLFKNNTALRKAVNYAIDRRALLAQSGYLAGSKTDQILPPGMPGFTDAKIYPLKSPDFNRAKRLAKGHTKDGNLVLYSSNRGAAILRAQIYQYDLGQLGLKVDVKQFPRAVQFSKGGVRGEPFDATDEGWGADYADPFDFINVLLDGDLIHAENNNNFAYMNVPAYNKRMAKAALLSGPARYRAYGQLDISIQKNVAPWASYRNASQRNFISKHFGCYVFNPVMQTDLAAACVK
jgi:peptide/nickel transport system substrate-binding protein